MVFDGVTLESVSSVEGVQKRRRRPRKSRQQSSTPSETANQQVAPPATTATTTTSTTGTTTTASATASVNGGNGTYVRIDGRVKVCVFVTISNCITWFVCVFLKKNMREVN